LGKKEEEGFNISKERKKPVKAKKFRRLGKD